eukprot:jgi/Mesen1/2114/ME000151S01363
MASNENKAANVMTPEAAARIQAAEAQKGGGGVQGGGFAARAQAAAAHNAPAGGDNKGEGAGKEGGKK